MRPRIVAALVQERLLHHPAVILVGPRQCGKTTLARELDGVYFDLEQPADRVRLDLAWDELTSKKPLIVLDEAQAWPEVLPRLRAAIDAKRRQMGRFLLLGSVAPGWMAQVSESLADRMAVVDMTPFHLAELAPTELDRLWRLGGYPDGGILGDRGFPQWQDSYLRLMACATCRSGDSRRAQPRPGDSCACSPPSTGPSSTGPSSDRAWA